MVHKFYEVRFYSWNFVVEKSRLGNDTQRTAPNIRDGRIVKTYAITLPVNSHQIIWMRPSKGQTGGHCHFTVKRDNSIQTYFRTDPSLYTGVLRINVAGYKKSKYIAKYICSQQRSIRNSALQIEERTINFADGTIF